MEDYRYCPLCRSELVPRTVEERDRGVCSGCGWIYYKNPLPAVACLVSREESGILLIKRAVEPYKGAWCIPGGFIEIDENIREAGIRELKEETGLEGMPGDLIGAYIQKSRMYGAVLIVGIAFTAEKGDPTPGDDAEEARFFAPKDMPDIPLESHRNLIRDFTGC
jgi:8-oxo-dGTP diphosphatase